MRPLHESTQELTARRWTSSGAPACLVFLGVCVVKVVQAFAAVGVRSAILVPVNRELGPKDAGFDERTNIHPDTVVEIRVPANRLIGETLPPDINVVGRLTLEN